MRTGCCLDNPRAVQQGASGGSPSACVLDGSRRPGPAHGVQPVCLWMQCFYAVTESMVGVRGHAGHAPAADRRLPTT